MKPRRHEWLDSNDNEVTTVCKRCGIARVRTSLSIGLIDKISAVYYYPEKPESIRYKAGNCVKKHKPKQ